jgi:hypothetical protein
MMIRVKHRLPQKQVLRLVMCTNGRCRVRFGRRVYFHFVQVFWTPEMTRRYASEHAAAVRRRSAAPLPALVRSENRCLVKFKSFAEYTPKLAIGSRVPFAGSDFK